MPFDSSHRRNKLLKYMTQGLEPPYLCGICGRRHVDPDAPQYSPDALVLDHLVPTSLGGSMYSIDNVRIASFRCNNKRNNSEALDIIKKVPGINY